MRMPLELKEDDYLDYYSKEYYYCMSYSGPVGCLKKIGRGRNAVTSCSEGAPKVQMGNDFNVET